MAMTFTQTDTSSTACVSSTQLAACSGRTGAFANGLKAISGGTAGSTPITSGVNSSASNVVEFAFELDVDASVSWDAGDWTVRLNVTTANMNITITEIYICRVSSTCVNQATIGSATGLSVSLGTTGVKSQTISGSAQTPAAGDKVVVCWVVSNGAMSSQSFDVTPNQNIDSPFSLVTQSLLWSPHRFLPHIVRRVRDFFKQLFNPFPIEA